MSEYIDSKYYCYNSISECLKHKQGCKFKRKQLLHQNPRLLIVNKTSGDILKTISDVQPLYLYPLSILDYGKLLLKKDMSLFSSITTVNIINFDANINYIGRLNKLGLKNLYNVEIEINEKHNNIQLTKIIKLLNHFFINNVKITLLFKTINIADELLRRISSLCDFIKIMMPNTLNAGVFKEFSSKLNIICSNKKNTSVVLIKSYLTLDQNDYYEETVKIFDELNIDIFQLSKELMPMGISENPLVAQDIQDNIRYLEKKYSNITGTRFISVKDISTLYYPRFKLDGRNSRKCYACITKPCLYKDKFLPCRVNKVITNIDNWFVANLDNNINEDNIFKCGVACDDCASIFENDILNDIKTTIGKYKGKNIEFILEMEDKLCY